MQTDKNHSLTFLASNSAPPPDAFFQGYFFSGNDYINGAEGAASFQAATGKQITGGYDGCYVHIQRHHDSYKFNIDFSGYKVLYYFHDGDIWAVSNSFAQVVNYIRKYKGRIRPNYPHLGTITGTNSTNNQLFSFETLAQGVRVVPRATELLITPQRAHLLPLPHRKARTYRDGLQKHLELWVSRFETLLSDERVQFSIDVTGGLDSRTNLALAVKALERLGTAAQLPRFTCGGTPSQSEDYRIASELCDFYGVPLNPPNRNKRIYYTPKEAYSAYQDLSLGVYHPLVVPAIAPSALRVQASGGGGEVHRDFFDPNQVTRYFRGFAKRNASTSLGFEAAKDGQISLEYMNTEGNPHPLRAHYREFRHRYHVGRMPRFSTCFTPLDSTTAEAAQLVAGRERQTEGQFNYDVLYSLDPELIDLPFDTPNKTPDVDIRSRLSREDIEPDAAPGEIWIGADPQLNRPSVSAGQRYKVVEKNLEKALDDTFVKAFWGEATISRARELSGQLSAGESVGNPVNAYPIVGVLASHLVSPNR